MKQLILCSAAALAAACLSFAPVTLRAQASEQEAAVIATALDYSDGAYSGDAVRMERAIHPDLNKVIFRRRSPSAGLSASYSTYSSLVEIIRTASIVIEPEKRQTQVSVLKIDGDAACARVRTARWCDYLQMIKINGHWKIINVLWTLGLDTPASARVVPGFDAAKEQPSAQAAAINFAEGQFSADVAQLEKTIHPETSQAVYMIAAKTNLAFVNRMRYSEIMEAARAKLTIGPDDARKADVQILDMMDGMAFAVARTGAGPMYLQLQLIDGQWKAINVLFRPASNVYAAGGPRQAVLGLPMPDFTLPAIQGGDYGPSKLKGKNVLIIFPRGKVDDHWCQICHYQYAELADLESQRGLRRAYNLEILFVLPYGETEVRHWTEIFPSQMAVIEGWKNPPNFEKLDDNRKQGVLRMRRFFSRTFDFSKTTAPIPFPILYDKDQSVSKMLGLFTTNWDRSAVEQNVPTMYLLNTSGEIRFKYTSQTTFDRPTAEYLVGIMDKLILNK